MTPASTRIIHLIERRGRLCGLARSDLDFLLAYHRSHLDLQPTHRRGVYRLTPRGCVGVIVTPGCRLEIGPKIPLPNLLHLLDPDDSFSITPAASNGGDAPDLIQLLAGRFAALLTERVTSGLPRDYVERRDDLTHLRGQLDVPAQVRDSRPNRDRLHCRFDEFTIDASCNRQVKAVAELIAACPAIEDQARGMIRRALAGFAEVGDEPPSDAAMADLIDQTRLSEYRPILGLCRLLHAAVSPGDPGSRIAPAFLLDLEHIFERYVTRGVCRTFAGSDVQVDVQPWLTIHGSVAAPQPSLHLRPDIVLRRDGRPLLVIDAKWKRFGLGPETGDLHQVLAYAAAVGSPQVVLIYPGKANRRWDYPLLEPPVRVGLHRLRVNGPPQRCAAALTQWAASLIA